MSISPNLSEIFDSSISRYTTILDSLSGEKKVYPVSPVGCSSWSEVKSREPLHSTPLRCAGFTHQLSFQNSLPPSLGADQS